MAISGIKNAYYYKYVSGGNFQLNGDPTAPLVTVQAATSGKTGFFFFDTADGQPPTDNDADGIYDNLTADVDLTDPWNSAGFIFLNAGTLSSTGLGGTPPARAMYAPGEPWIESNGTDGWQIGETVLDLTYPTGDPTHLPYPTFTKVGTSTTARAPKGPDRERGGPHGRGHLQLAATGMPRGTASSSAASSPSQGSSRGAEGPPPPPTSGSTSA